MREKGGLKDTVVYVDEVRELDNRDGKGNWKGFGGEGQTTLPSKY